MIIKCPECGHQISDKAPTCPSCGVEIAGNITHCPNCGKVYFNDEDMCPACHQPNESRHEKPAKEHEEAPIIAPVMQAKTENPAQNRKPEKKGGHTALIVSFILALIICGVCFYMYKQAQDNKENEEYEFAQKSTDPLVLQSFLDTYKDAPKAHRDSINAHLQRIKQAGIDWTNALVSSSKSALEEYLQKYPDTPHRAEAKHKIDSIDWAVCQQLSTVDAYQEYMKTHVDGDHYDEAEESMKKLKAQDLTPEDMALVGTLFHDFFVSINSRDQEVLQASVADELTLLDKTNATKSDVVEFMNKLYKDDVASMTWKLANDYKVNKREVGDMQYEFSVECTATQEVAHTDGKSKTNKYRINAAINPDGKFSIMKLVRLVE